LRKLPILKDVSENKLYILSSLCKIEAHNKDDRLIVEGEIGDKMYIILSGECTVLHTTAPAKVNALLLATIVQLLYIVLFADSATTAVSCYCWYAQRRSHARTGYYSCTTSMLHYHSNLPACAAQVHCLCSVVPSYTHIEPVCSRSKHRSTDTS
jgi:hypothetical protein